MPDTISVFKNAKAEELFMAAYDEVFKLWPIPYETTTVPTRIGETHVIISGPEDGKPLVLLHGAFATSTMWFPNVGELGAKYRIYAVDTVSDVGKSKMSIRPRKRIELADWLVEVFDGLGIRNPHLMGLSYGGFITANMASFYPEKIDKIVMLAPAAVIQKLAFMFFYKVLSAMVFPSENRLKGVLMWMGAEGFEINGTYETLMTLALRKGSSKLSVRPPQFSDEELKGIEKPALLFVGDQEVIYDAQKAIERANRLMPNIETELVADCGHVVSMEKPEFVNQRVLAFLEKA